MNFLEDERIGKQAKIKAKKKFFSERIFSYVKKNDRIEKKKEREKMKD